jgi:hypothetical protein
MVPSLLSASNLDKMGVEVGVLHHGAKHVTAQEVEKLRRREQDIDQLQPNTSDMSQKIGTVLKGYKSGCSTFQL